MELEDKLNKIIEISGKIREIYKNSTTLRNEKEAVDYGIYAKNLHDQWYEIISENIIDFRELYYLPKNSVLLTPTTANGEFQVVEGGNPNDVLTFIGSGIAPQFLPAPSGSPEWGDIIGNILDQIDLISYISSQGFITSETDPIFTASDAFGIDGSDIAMWNEAYSWGDHALGGYLTSYSETDPVWLADKPNYLTSVIAASTYSVLGHTHTFASLTSKPTTLSGYGITDAYPLTGNPSGFLTSVTAGGSNTQLQYNNAGVLGGITGFTWNGTTLTLSPALNGSQAVFSNLVTGRNFVASGNSTVGSGFRSATGGAGWTGATYNHFYANPSNFPTATGLMRGFYAQLTGTLASNGVVGYENTGGDNFFNTVSGATMIGRTTASGVITTAKLAIDSTTQGFLPPRMTTTQKTAIVSPEAGLVVYDTTLNQLSYFNNTTWINI